jgi:hypothetical protein
LGAGVAGVVDEDVDSAQLSERCRDLVEVGDVERRRHGVTAGVAQGGRVRVGPLGDEVVDGDGCSCLGEERGDGCADALAGAG